MWARKEEVVGNKDLQVVEFKVVVFRLLACFLFNLGYRTQGSSCKTFFHTYDLFGGIDG